ncbi:hypothetical protein C8Q74DRAFT_1292866 [Fomes fomentarius]|nr:hypothetical protein C8Q74DRAFT_1292866 [Fomes fomentarius]
MSLHRFLMNIDVVHAVFDHFDLFPRPITDYERAVYVEHEAIVVLNVLSLLNFASGHRVCLHRATGRVFDNICSFVCAARI